MSEGTMGKEPEREEAVNEVVTWREALNWGKDVLLKAEIPDGRWDAEHLFRVVMNCDRTGLLLNGSEILSEEQKNRYRDLIEKRKSRVPLQYLTGEQEFMGLPFYVNQDVLIPRQDTECLVETVLKVLEEGCESAKASEGLEGAQEKSAGAEKTAEFGKIQILDLCTGSGCIGISIGKLAGKGQRQKEDALKADIPKKDTPKGNALTESCRIEVVCSDISEKALEVAKRNAVRNGVEITWIESNLFENITGKFHAIVSNPPYITGAEMEELMPEVRLFEPKEALYGMEDGLYFYREITRQAPEYLEENGMLFFEIGCRQGQEVSGLMEQAGFQDIRIEKDLAGLDRIVYGRI